MKKRGRWVLREIRNGGEDEEGREEFYVKMEMEDDGEMGCRVQEEGGAEREIAEREKGDPRGESGQRGREGGSRGFCACVFFCLIPVKWG